MQKQSKTCYRCHAILSEDNTFYIRIGEPPSKAICDKCHTEYTAMMEALFSSGKIAGGSDREGIMKAKGEWLGWIKQGRH